LVFRDICIKVRGAFTKTDAIGYDNLGSISSSSILAKISALVFIFLQEALMLPYILEGFKGINSFWFKGNLDL